MQFEYTGDGKVIISMPDFMRKLIDEFPEKIIKTSPTPATDDLFAVGEEIKLPPEQAKIFHTWVAKALFACKRARPDIQTSVAFLCVETTKSIFVKENEFWVLRFALLPCHRQSMNRLFPHSNGFES